MKAELMVTGFIIMLGGALFFLVVSPGETLWLYVTGFILLVGIVFFVLGVMQPSYGTHQKLAEHTLSSGERYNKNCIYLTTKGTRRETELDDIMDNNTPRYYCSARRSGYGEPRPIDRCQKNCPYFKP